VCKIFSLFEVQQCCSSKVFSLSFHDSFQQILGDITDMLGFKFHESCFRKFLRREDQFSILTIRVYSKKLPLSNRSFGYPGSNLWSGTNFRVMFFQMQGRVKYVGILFCDNIHYVVQRNIGVGYIGTNNEPSLVVRNNFFKKRSPFG
jgi:hypothetical protein